MATNEMILAKAFREAAGLDQAKADRLAETIFNAIRDNVATKADLAHTEQAFNMKFGEVNLQLAKLERRLRFCAIGAFVLFAALRFWPPH
jgi:glutathionyl-hydroquinone reductase